MQDRWQQGQTVLNAACAGGTAGEDQRLASHLPCAATPSPATSLVLQLALRTREGDQAKAAAVGASPRHLQLINDLHGPHLQQREREQQGLMERLGSSRQACAGLRSLQGPRLPECAGSQSQVRASAPGVRKRLPRPSHAQATQRAAPERHSLQHTHLGRSADGARRQRRPQRVPGCEARLELPRHCETGWGRRRGTVKAGDLAQGCGSGGLPHASTTADSACGTTAGSLDSPVLPFG